MDNLRLSKRFYVYKKSADGQVKVLGNGVVQLLKAVSEKGSINLACKELSLSYSKALRILQNCEESLKVDVIVHQKGGFERAGSVLTENGKKLIAIWDEFVSDCDDILASRSESLLSSLDFTNDEK